MTETNFFKADLRELEFALFEQGRLAELLKSPPFDHLTEEDARLVLKEAHQFAMDVIGPTMSAADREGCQLTPDGVKAPKVLHSVWKRYFESGWQAVALPESRGGMGAPLMLSAAVGEMLSGANTAFHMYPGLTMAAAGIIATLGTPEQKELYSSKLESGEWGGTMVLTEPNAGSDVGLSTTRAVRNDDGTFSIAGNKSFISGGDHDMADNIVHLALARIEGAPKGSRGLSLFIIPKIRVNGDGSLGEPNDVVCTHVEEKLGIHGSATCALAFGENGGCIGHLLGGEPMQGDQPGAGMRKMFMMMNGARIGVGTQSLAVASTAYYNALDYARTRLQGAHYSDGRPEKGAVPIIEHPDVRRMLLEMKSRVEGCRALLYSVVRMVDEASTLEKNDPEAAEALQDYLGLFIPLVKAHISDESVAVSSLGLQVFGGAGYTKDFPAEQYYRDSRIFPIYEGTNGIQALDLVGRKLAQSGGALMQRFVKELGELAGDLSGREEYKREAELLGESQAALQIVLEAFMEFLTSGRQEQILLFGTPFQELMGKIACACLLLEGALTAEAGLESTSEESRDRDFYRGKIAAARYYTRNVLPSVVGAAEIIAAGDDTAMHIPNAGYSLSY